MFSIQTCDVDELEHRWDDEQQLLDHSWSCSLFCVDTMHYTHGIQFGPSWNHCISFQIKRQYHLIFSWAFLPFDNRNSIFRKLWKIFLDRRFCIVLIGIEGIASLSIKFQNSFLNILFSFEKCFHCICSFMSK